MGHSCMTRLELQVEHTHTLGHSEELRVVLGEMRRF